MCGKQNDIALSFQKLSTRLENLLFFYSLIQLEELQGCIILTIFLLLGQLKELQGCIILHF